KTGEREFAAYASETQTSVLWIRLRESTRPEDQRPCDGSQLPLCSARRGHSKLGPLSYCTICRGGSRQTCLLGRSAVVLVFRGQGSHRMTIDEFWHSQTNFHRNIRVEPCSRDHRELETL